MKKNPIIIVIVLLAILGAALIYSSTAQDSTSGLRVTAPNGGESLKWGINYDILWEADAESASNIGSVYAQSSVETQELYVIAKDIDLNSEGFGWKVSYVLRNNRIITGAVPAGEYKIKVCYNVSGFCDESDGYFTVAE